MARKLKIPKRIAGVKIPKSIRKGLNSSAGQIVLAEALLACGAIFAARRLDADSGAGAMMRHPIDTVRSKIAGTGLDDRLTSASDQMGRAFRAGLAAFRASLAESAPDERAPIDQTLDMDATGMPGEDDSDAAKKKPRRSRQEPSQPDTTSGPH
jgi:hypothetical protein